MFFTGVTRNSGDFNWIRAEITHKGNLENVWRTRMLTNSYQSLGKKLIASFVVLAILSGVVSYIGSQIAFNDIREDVLPSQRIVADGGLVGRAFLISALEFSGTGEEKSLEEYELASKEILLILESLEVLGDDAGEGEVFHRLAESIRNVQDVAQLIFESHAITLKNLEALTEIEEELAVIAEELDELLVEEIARNIRSGDLVELEEITLPYEEAVFHFAQFTQLLRVETLEFVASGNTDAITHFEQTLEVLEVAQANLGSLASPNEPREILLLNDLIEIKEQLVNTGRNMIGSHTATLNLLVQLEETEDELNSALEAANQAVEEDVKRVLQTTTTNTILGALLVTGVSIVVGVAISKTIVRPVVNLVEAADQLAVGDLTARANVNSKDEIGLLASSFNQMAGQLQESFDALEAQNSELERFTYTVSHDLKSPLITIRGFMGMLQNDVAAGDTARIESDVLQINAAVDQMERLLEDLLDLSRLGRMINPEEEINLNELIDTALNLVSGQIDSGGVEVDIQPNLPRVYGDRTRLLEVFQNLIENAAKYMGDQSEPRIQIGINTDGKRPIYFVSDNGMGIDTRYHKKIFGLFERLDSQGAGTGIGLALVKRIIELHDGRIWVESDGRGKGSTFRFTLPQDK